MRDGGWYDRFSGGSGRRQLGGLIALMLATALACGPAHAGLEDRPLESDEAETVRPGTLSASLGWEYARDRKGEVELSVPIDLTYGIAKNFELGVEIPFLFLRPDGADDAEGFGDVSLRPEWVFVEESRVLPSLAFAAVAKLPTGSERKDLGSGRADYSLELLASKTFGPLLASVNVVHSFVGGDDDIFQPAANVAYSLNEKWALVAEWLGEISDKKHSLRSLVGVIYEIARGIALDAGVGFGLVNADLDWSVTVGITYDVRF